MIIRTLTEADARIYQSLRLRALREDPEAFGSSYEQTAQHPIEWFAERIQARPDSRFVLGAFEQKQLIGTVGVHRIDGEKFNHKGEIWGMYVAPEFRQQRIGRALMTEAIRQARSMRGLEQLSLGVMQTQATARALYVSLDFVPWGLEPQAIRVNERYIDEEYMTLKLH